MDTAPPSVIEDDLVRAEDAGKARRILYWTAFALTVAASLLVEFLLPEPDDWVGVAQMLLPLAPILITLVPLGLPAGRRSPTGLVVASAVTLIAAVGSFTGGGLGGFYAPSALLLWAAILVPRWVASGRDAGTGRAWRIGGAFAIALPAFALLGGLLTGSLQDGIALQWAVLIGVTALAVLFALRVRFTDWIAAGLGAALMGLAVIDGGILTLAFWWVGGLWLAVGICSIAAGRKAR